MLITSRCRFLKDLNLEVYKNEILGIIGPANSGKTTFLRALNRLNYLNISYRQKGEIIFENQNAADIEDSLLAKKNRNNFRNAAGAAGKHL